MCKIRLGSGQFLDLPGKTRKTLEFQSPHFLEHIFYTFSSYTTAPYLAQYRKSPVAVVSIIGENLRKALPELGFALEEVRMKSIFVLYCTPGR